VRVEEEMVEEEMVEVMVEEVMVEMGHSDIEDASKKAMCAIDGGGFDWSDMAEDEVQANMALMAFTASCRLTTDVAAF
ncbi:hypothetical protein Tco_0289035, partial [Tanacetum coccineum]